MSLPDEFHLSEERNKPLLLPLWFAVGFSLTSSIVAFLASALPCHILVDCDASAASSSARPPLPRSRHEMMRGNQARCQKVTPTRGAKIE